MLTAYTTRVQRRLGVRPAIALVFPLLLFDLLVFVVPFGYLLRMSLHARQTTRAYATGTWSLSGYRYLLEPSNTVAETFVFTLGFATVVTTLSVVVATLYAYAMWRTAGVVRVGLTAGALTSMFTAIVVKLFAAVLIYAPNGVVNTALLSTGVLAEPLTLVNNGVGAVIGQLYIVVPYSIFAVYAVLSTIDESLVEAARDLGANSPRAFREVAVPHAVPGVIVAGVISFTWSLGAYAAPLLLGSGSERTAGILLSDLLLRDFDWSAAAALGVVITMTVLTAIATTQAVLRRRSGDDT
ncbi:ABC transporter permease [Halorubrum sp. SY-15]|jgi:spermidine/putrescine transport system permease protein|uniref:ABC transporter permease n=1 Tax=Halorubrum sp. SY-15 TaxID=3402277 RepID=UPI003EBC7568